MEAIRAARRLEVLAAQTAYWPARDARRDANLVQAAAALGLDERGAPYADGPLRALNRVTAGSELPAEESELCHRGIGLLHRSSVVMEQAPMYGRH
ncbi:hypothetical protein GFH48_06215 [Streptomyces fagopyri]|uniref:Uncharacterized protein n=1 Tax=Streptomyces fagopyri TaxID=2662397 RepID=A0A5Q0L874_9ACTN|nr:hypothetical protein [Streptomyces fagopyri]QFZ72916.1 hypothetical protein GFH48_06215 [Streptomyces fagopyri]